MMKPYNLHEYEIVVDTKKTNKLYYGVLILLLIEIIFIICKFNFKVYSKYTLIKHDDYYVTFVDSREISFLEENKNLYINNKKYNYIVKKIDDNITNINDSIYQSIYIAPINYSSNANYIECFILKSKSTIFDMVIKFMNGGI